MGDPRRIRKKYKTPNHPWEGNRIQEEKLLMKEYGLKCKKELWKMNSRLKRYKDQAKALYALTGKQADFQKNQLIKKLKNIKLLQEDADLDDILGLTIQNILDRRLQTLLYKKGLARSIKQARQFIVHEQIMVSNRKITFPSYIVPISEEEFIAFDPLSSLASIDHPERSELKAKEIEPKKEVKQEKTGKAFKKERKTQPRKENVKKEKNDKNR